MWPHVLNSTDRITHVKCKAYLCFLWMPKFFFLFVSSTSLCPPTAIIKHFSSTQYTHEQLCLTWICITCLMTLGFRTLAQWIIAFLWPRTLPRAQWLPLAGCSFLLPTSHFVVWQLPVLQLDQKATNWVHIHIVNSGINTSKVSANK
jgi:hypothetical protein